VKATSSGVSQYYNEITSTTDGRAHVGVSSHIASQEAERERERIERVSQSLLKTYSQRPKDLPPAPTS
jgi:hypothetical protein